MYVCAMMRTRVVRVDPENIDPGQIRAVAAIVDQGGLVAFPTETVYGIACRADTGALGRLDAVKGRPPGKPYTLHIASSEETAKYVPRMGLRARKLAERAWPGPLTMVFELSGEQLESQRKALGDKVFAALYRDGCIGIRCPDNAIAAALIRGAANPLVAPSANRSGESPPTDGGAVIAALDGAIDLVLDAGPCRHGKSSTVVKIGKDGLEILRHGAYDEGQVRRMMTVEVLFVCTGNTCRSPMAEGIFRKYLAQKLGCEVDRLGDIGYKVSSAGVLDLAGSPASSEAVVACQAKGVDIAAHRSRVITDELVEESDLILVMEREHRATVVGLRPDAADKCFLLAGDEGVFDPIGQSMDVYLRCADVIERAVRKWISELEG